MEDFEHSRMDKVKDLRRHNLSQERQGGANRL